MSKRRYFTGQYEIYDRKFMQLKNSSQILSGSTKGISFSTILFDEAALEAVKIELIGEGKSGEYKRRGVDMMGKIPAIKEELREFNLRFKSLQLDAKNQGKEIPSFEDLPAGMLEKKWILEARKDVAVEELEKINLRLKEYSDKVEEKESGDILKFGLQQSGILRDGQLSVIDFQNVSKIHGVLCIDEPTSPYHLLSVVAYRELSVQWLSDMQVADAKILKAMQEKAKAAGENIPRFFTRCSGSQRVPRNLLPPCPKIEEVSTNSEKE